MYNMYRSYIDGLRAFAVFAVLGFHAFPDWFKGGFIGVDIFFVISGYLISTSIFKSLDNGNFQFSEFYGRRIKRIFPALTLVLVVCLIFSSFTLLADEFKNLGKHIAAGTIFASNFILWNEVSYFESPKSKLLLHLWSLGIEEQFYIIFPVLIWATWKLKFNILIILIFFTIISFILNFQGIRQDAIATFYSPQTRFWEILVGSLLAWLRIYKVVMFNNIEIKFDSYISNFIHGGKHRSEGKILSNILSLIGFCMLFYGFFKINKNLNYPGMWALIPTVGTLFILISGSKAWLNHKILSNKVFVWFGLISYPLYLWHWPLLSLTNIIWLEAPSINVRIIAVMLSIFFAWLTYKFIEIPLRFGEPNKDKTFILCGLIIVVGFSGYIIYKNNFFKFRTFENLPIKRQGLEYNYGTSLKWFIGKDDWLFLGNAIDNNMMKLKLNIIPTEKEVNNNIEIFSKIAATAVKYDTKVVLIIGPEKARIYPEYLPDNLLLSTKKYSNFFLNELIKLPNIIIYDPTDDFLSIKRTEGFLYSRTDSHWNNKGAFFGYVGFSRLLNLPFPKVEFKQAEYTPGDLLELSKLNNFPLHLDDNWEVILKNDNIFTQSKNPFSLKKIFSSAYLVTNKNPISNKYIWVVGDSFTAAVKQYFNTTYKDVLYYGSWKDQLNILPDDLESAERKPDMIIIVRAERSF